MRHLNKLGCGLLIAAAVVGCGPGKELPDDIPTISNGGSSSDPLGPVPAASDPAAIAVAQRTVKAITKDTPELLGKAKVCQVISRGTTRLPLPGGMESIDSLRRWESVWPDRVRVTNEFQNPNLTIPTKVFRLIRPQGWLTDGGQVASAFSPETVGQMIYSDTMGRHWMALGLPLADPQAVVFDPKKTPAGMVVKVALPDLPIYAVTFDDKTGLPARVEFHPVEAGKRLDKVQVFGDHKPAGGLVLPTSLEFIQNGHSVEQWTAESWEFPEKIDDSRFEEPK